MVGDDREEDIATHSFIENTEGNKKDDDEEELEKIVFDDE
jgi:hypothetical protein